MTFAYDPNPQMKVLKKALFILSAGNTLKTLEETGEANAMRTVMLGDRIRNRAIEKEMIIFDGTSHWDEELRENKICGRIRLENTLKQLINWVFTFNIIAVKIKTKSGVCLKEFMDVICMN